MGEVIEVENRVDEKGIRHVHLMANRDVTIADLAIYLPPKDAHVTVGIEAGACHLRAWWPYFGMLEMRSECWPASKRLVVKKVQQGDRISAVVNEAAREFLRLFGVGPHYVRIRRLPTGVDNGMVIMYQGWEMILTETEWMMEGCVGVEGRGMCGEQVEVDSEQLAVMSEQ